METEYKRRSSRYKGTQLDNKERLDFKLKIPKCVYLAQFLIT